ncbi:hypothetical protein C8J57DRAFT_1246731 [Mycena rebaudengoi]|nr:hypothetical protein C8J57DRAFT_1246731 [Mycena rebaudengoi]
MRRLWRPPTLPLSVCLGTACLSLVIESGIKREPGLVNDYCLEYGEPAPRVRYYYSIKGRRVPMKPSYWMYRSPEPDRGAAENPTTRPMRAPSREEKDIPASHLTEAALSQGLARVEQPAPLPAALTEENAAGLANYNANNNEKVRAAERDVDTATISSGLQRKLH